MKKHEALRLKPGTRVQVQHGNNRPIVPEKFVTVESVRWLPWSAFAQRHGASVKEAAIPMRSIDAKKTAAHAEWVSIRDTDGNDWGSNELILPEEWKP